MAASLKSTVSFNKDNIALVTVNESRTSTGDSFAHQVITVSTTETTYTIPTDIGSAREVVIRNKDATNYVQVGFATGVYYLRLQAGRVNKLDIEPAHASLFLLADTAACELEIIVMEE